MMERLHSPPTDLMLYSTIKRSRHELYVLSKEQIIEMVTDLLKDVNGRKKIASMLGVAKTVYGYVPVATDLNSLRKLLQDIGVRGHIRFTTKYGREYAVFRGHPGIRKIFTGTRYSTANPKVVAYAIGSTGIRSSIKSGARVCMIGFLAFNLLNAFLADTSFLSSFIGTTATDLGKVVLSSLAGYAAGKMILTFGITLGGAPIFGMVLAGYWVGSSLDDFDKRNQITERVVDVIWRIEKKAKKGTDELVDELSKSYLFNTQRFIRDMEHWILNGTIRYR